MSDRDIPLVAIDANTFDRDGPTRDALIERFLAAAAAGRLRVFVPTGVAAEMRHPQAPERVRRAADAAMAEAVPPRPPSVPLTARQHIDRIRVRAVMRGDGRPGKHDADASHLSEAAEAGCSHFITRDSKVLRKRDLLSGALPSGLRVVTLDEFMAGSRREPLRTSDGD